MHQLIVTDSTDARTHGEPDELAEAELAEAERIAAKVGSLSTLSLPVPGGRLHFNARHVVSAQLVEVDD